MADELRSVDRIMKRPQETPSGDRHELANERRQRLRGKPLASRMRFLTRRSLLFLLYLVVTVVAFFVAFRFERWLLKGIGFTILALLAAVAFEVIGEGLLGIHKAFDYRKHREEWELANGFVSDAPDSPGIRGLH
jgi:hypothetical protein